MASRPVRYASKSDVYLDGGPGPNAPPGAAALAPGDYYFQVTDPSGHTLLSSDDISCREIEIGQNGTIAAVLGPCPHVTGTDRDDGALTVQLMPYADTPNPGGEYKLWVMPVADYDGRFHPRYSKTDNFKVRAGSTESPDAGSETPPDAAPPPPPSPDAGAGDACTPDGSQVP